MVSTFDIQSPRRRFTADEVIRLLEVGVLGEDEPVELISGDLIVVSPQGPQHRTIIIELADRLRAAFDTTNSHVQTQVPLYAGEDSLPEPDVAVIKGAARDFMDRHPRGKDALLVVEVAATSHAIDRAKAAVYATAGVAEYWLLDLPARRIEVYRHPRPDGTYGATSWLSDTERIQPPGLDTHWNVSDLLP